VVALIFIVGFTVSYYFGYKHGKDVGYLDALIYMDDFFE
jgi:hypothetical protein